jgi:hypothetical protein
VDPIGRETEAPDDLVPDHQGINNDVARDRRIEAAGL